MHAKANSPPLRAIDPIDPVPCPELHVKRANASNDLGPQSYPACDPAGLAIPRSKAARVFSTLGGTDELLHVSYGCIDLHLAVKQGQMTGHGIICQNVVSVEKD